MRVFTAYGRQFGRYRITQMAKQKNQYDNTNDIFLDIWRGVLLVAAPGMAHLVSPPVAVMGAWCTLAEG